MGEARLSGGCLCGGVRYELSEPPLAAGYCHCTRCQRRTGNAASISATIAPGSLRILSGGDLLGEFAPADGYAKVFCRACGSALWSRHPEDADRVSIRMGTFDRDPGVRPAWRQFVADAAPWEPIPDDGLPRYAGRRPTA